MVTIAGGILLALAALWVGAVALGVIASMLAGVGAWVMLVPVAGIGWVLYTLWGWGPVAAFGVWVAAIGVAAERERRAGRPAHR